jgi:hypothetical protein
MRSKPIIGILLALLVAPATAMAQTGQPDPNAPGDNNPNTDTSNAPNRDGDPADEELGAYDENDDVGGPLPASKSDDDVQPPVATPGAPVGMVVRQAGVGGQVGYGRAGVLELGGSAGLTVSPDFTAVNVSPQIGWFVADNLELSGLVGFTHVETDMDSGTLTTALIEPSYHLPFTRTAFGFLGVGMGAAYVSGPGIGFAMAPRLGANLMIGRSGVLTPSLSYQYTTHNAEMVGRSGILTPSLSWQYTTHDTMDVATGGDTTGQLLVVSSALRANIGYTVMW